MLDLPLENVSYADITKLVKKGFSVKFPWGHGDAKASVVLETCLSDSKG